MSGLEEKVSNIIRDIRWVISTATKPDDEEFKLTSRFILLLVFIAGAFQLVFHIAGVYLRSAITGTPAATLGDPVKESMAVLSSMVVILVGMLYLMFKLR
ncbi:MAG: hypothetical protein ABWK05_05085 [Pyrobaculum sp.]